jgi:hypothetical protein
MGLIENILIGILHLAFAAVDVLFLLVLLKIVHDRWRVAWIEPILTAVQPAMSVALNRFASLILRITGESYLEKTLLVLLIICLLVMRFLVVRITG